MQHRKVIKFGNLIKAFNGIDHFKEFFFFFFWLLGFLNKGLTTGLLLLISSARPSFQDIVFCLGWDQRAIPNGDEKPGFSILFQTVSH